MVCCPAWTLSNLERWLRNTFAPWFRSHKDLTDVMICRRILWETIGKSQISPVFSMTQVMFAFCDIQAHTFRTNILPTRVTVFSPTLSLLTSRPHCLGLWWVTPWALALGEETPIQIDDCGFTRWFFHPEQVLLIWGMNDILQWQWPSYAAKWLSDLVLRYSPASKNPHGWLVGIWNDLKSYSLWYAPRCAPWTPISNWFYQAPPTTSWSFPVILLSSAGLRQISSCVTKQLVGIWLVVWLLLQVIQKRENWHLLLN